MDNATLLNYIGYLRMIHKNYYSNMHSKYHFGINCDCEEQNLILTSYFIEEIENYYLNCSCLEEEDICQLIVNVQKILSK